ncbi:hypothetical protein D3867_35890 (plasmid) [Azospirillum argentinense]|uniref:Uncharacterized protein n=1 Tax=Azospirillum brasilense TaxID=192 RepID=A0A4D8QK34_AZOBR|nr:hypothetical protein D3867_35890 [Azospirillum argentinense]
MAYGIIFQTLFRPHGEPEGTVKLILAPADLFDLGPQILRWDVLHQQSPWFRRFGRLPVSRIAACDDPTDVPLVLLHVLRCVGTIVQPLRFRFSKASDIFQETVTDSFF